LYEKRETNVVFVSLKVVFEKLFSKLSCVCLTLGKLINGKHFPVNGKYFPIWFPEKYLPFIFGWKTLSGSCEKFRNVILFTDYI